jgi:hypothetical protein
MASNSDRRLDRLLPALSAKERALLVLRHQKAGREPPRDMMATMPSGQALEFHRLVGLMNAVNCELSYALFFLDERVGQLATRHGWLMSMMLCFDELQGLGHAVLGLVRDEKAKRELRRQLARMPGSFALPVDPAAPLERGPRERSLDWIARALVTTIREGLPQRWGELRAIEIVVGEIAEEFGEDPLRPDARALLEGAKETCLQLQKDIRPFVAPFELAEPTSEQLGLTRRLVEAACRTAS